MFLVWLSLALALLGFLTCADGVEGVEGVVDGVDDLNGDKGIGGGIGGGCWGCWEAIVKPKKMCTMYYFFLMRNFVWCCYENLSLIFFSVERTPDRVIIFTSTSKMTFDVMPF